MSRPARTFLWLLVLGLLAAGGAGVLLWSRLVRFGETPFGSAEQKVLEVAPGTGQRQALRLLARAGVLSDERLAWLWSRYVAPDPRPLRAGEYAFEGELRPAEVLEKLRRGEVLLHQVTIPEGLRMEEIAALVEEAGLGEAGELLASMRDATFARELGLPFQNLEGFLFPDTYSFARGPKPREVIGAMVRRFKQAWSAAEAQRAPGIGLDEGQAVTLASIVEKETGQPEERAHIACVFHNRIRRGMRLQTDPTVMYANMLRNGGRWSQNISRADLAAPHPYNTYTSAGLPPGPIASPGEASLVAALHPAECDDLYFVSRNDGTHVFCPTLACHAAAVQTWQVEFFRKHPRTGASKPAGAEGH